LSHDFLSVVSLHLKHLKLFDRSEQLFHDSRVKKVSVELFSENFKFLPREKS